MFLVRCVFLTCIFATIPACRDATPLIIIDEPLGPMDVLEAGGMLDGGTKIGALRDSKGDEY